LIHCHRASVAQLIKCEVRNRAAGVQNSVRATFFFPGVFVVFVKKSVVVVVVVSVAGEVCLVCGKGGMNFFITFFNRG